MKVFLVEALREFPRPLIGQEVIATVLMDEDELDELVPAFAEFVGADGVQATPVDDEFTNLQED